MAVPGAAADAVKQQQLAEEHEAERRADMQLSSAYELPKNISDMKSFAWGMFTWRDVIVSGGIFMVFFVLSLPFHGVIGQIPAIIVAAVCSLPFIFLAIRHHFTGDLPIEDRIMIAVDNFGKSNLLVWDKTKGENGYVGTSTHDFVPAVNFGADDLVMLPGNKGGFSVFQVVCDDSDFVKQTERVHMRNGFCYMLNKLVNENENIPIQILLKADRQNIDSFIEAAESDLFRIEDTNARATPQLMKAERARDYVGYLSLIANWDVFYYDYYVIVTYREDAEEVGNESLKSASVTRERIKDNMNPLKEQQKAAANVETDIGEDRAAALARSRHDAPYGEFNTRNALNNRNAVVSAAIERSRTTHTSITARPLTKNEISKLFFQCYNSDSDRLLDAVIDQSILPKPAVYSQDVVRDFPELFPPKQQRQVDRTMLAQQRGAITGSRGGR